MPVDPDSPNPRSANADGYRRGGLRDVLEPVPGGIVSAARRAGFIRGGKVARRAEVIVARAPVGGE